MGELVLDLGAPRAVARFVLWPTALTDVIVPLEISGSMDGAAWRRLGVAPERVAQPAFVVGTRPVFRPRNGWLELVIAPQTVRYLRVRPAEPGSVGWGWSASCSRTKRSTRRRPGRRTWPPCCGSFRPVA